jgi:hypothetical protein
MPIKRPPAENSAPESESQPAAVRRTNPAIDARLNEYIEHSQADFARYTTLVKEDPVHAVRTLMLKDMNKFEDEMRLVTKQLPEAKKFLEGLSKTEQAAIQAKVATVDPMFRDHRLVKEVRARMDRASFIENRRRLMPPKEGAPRVAA